jgi:SAM-dependent methyltransferase
MRLRLPGWVPRTANDHVSAAQTHPPRSDLTRSFPVGSLADERSAVSEELFGRLSADRVEAIERAVEDSEELRDLAAGASDPVIRRMLVLHFGMLLDPSAISAATGLSPAQPPEDVHAMARGPLALAGGLYEADLVADALRSAGADIRDARAVLDFGCSSGRVVRVFSAAYPGIRWLGCDPNARAIGWAAENLPGIEFLRSQDEPPLSLQDGSLDAAFAISIWSHFEPQLGLRWFEEMRRLIRPGGHLVVTTHGMTSVAHYVTHGLRGSVQGQEIADSLYRQGSWYAPEFGAKGDWGVVNPSWGTTFLSPEWLLSALCPRWHVLEFAAGRNAGNQDVYVLQRV